MKELVKSYNFYHIHCSSNLNS